MFKDYSKFMGYLVLTIVILALVGAGLRLANVFGERVVFENSFQYKEGMSQRALTLEAQIADIEMSIIKSPEMSDQLNAQKKVLQIQLKGMK